MIYNKRQLASAKEEIKSLRDSIQSLYDQNEPKNKLQKQIWENLINEINSEIFEYENLINKKEIILNKDNFDKLAVYLRIASGLSQKKLGEKLFVKEQQIQRWEKDDYLKANFERIVQIVRALSDDINITLILDNADDDRFKKIIEMHPNIKNINDEFKQRHALAI